MLLRDALNYGKSKSGRRKKQGEIATSPLWKFLSDWREPTEALTDSGHSVSLCVCDFFPIYLSCEIGHGEKVPTHLLSCHSFKGKRPIWLEPYLKHTHTHTHTGIHTPTLYAHVL